MTPQELKQQAHKEFNEKKQELKDWLHGTVYKGYDLEELSECVQEDVDTFLTTDFLDSLIDRTVQMTEERIVGIVEEMQSIQPVFLAEELEPQVPALSDDEYRKKLEELISRITNKSDINR